MVSIVVPVYNVEKYLDKCVKSLINQTYKNIEILLIDDGSTDNSGNKCDEYADKDERIKAFHKTNGGLSDARNYGMDKAEGEYIAFIDSDDYVEPDMIEVLVNSIGDADMAMCGMFEDYASGEISGQATAQSFEVCGSEAFKLMLEGEIIQPSVCNRIIKTEIAKLQQFPVGKCHEDAFFNNKLMMNIKSVKVNTTKLYHYVHRKDSITTRKFNERDMDAIRAYTETQAIVNDKMPEIKDAARMRLLWVYLSTFDKMILQDNFKDIPYFQEVLKFIRSHSKEIAANKTFSKSRRIAVGLLNYNVSIYRMMVRNKYKKSKELYG